MTTVLLLKLIIVAIPLLLLHHFYTHRNDADKTTPQKWFQWTDINNHETVILLLAGIAIGIILSWLL